MMRPLGVLLAGLLALAGCGRGEGGDGAAPAAQGRVLDTREVGAIFLGWGADPVGGLRLRVADREIHAWSPDRPTSYFLEANRGQPLRVRLETVRASAPGIGDYDSIYVRNAWVGEMSAQQWWRAIGPQQRLRTIARLQHIAMEPPPAPPQ